MKFKASIILLALTLITVASCALMKPVARTANDIALKTCTDTFGAPGVQLPKGMTAKDMCEHHENLQPFIDNILAAKSSVGTAQGVTFKKE